MRAVAWKVALVLAPDPSARWLLVTGFPLGCDDTGSPGSGRHVP